TVLADSSVQRGSDIFKLLACGAKAVMVGRALLYGTAAGGQAGALRMIKILTDELALTMDMSGCRTLADIDRDMITTQQ
ncbi:MAG TPA: alpha-hydroxy-acid oxidizing protein, partial [Bauldia sp.]|nr:alpha-hydroxy-acid oxidizing protein [Bauldia sp.]